VHNGGIARRILQNDEAILPTKNSYPIIEIVRVFNFQEANCLLAA
jgi:hypothetical protein